MDRDKAKFILSSFRSDGSDAHDPAFAEALALAAEDRQLGDWLADERAADASFADAIQGIEIPADLRDEIMLVISGDVPEIVMDAMDGEFVGALSQLQAPADLRGNILTAMEAQVKVTSFAEAKDEVKPEVTQKKDVKVGFWRPLMALSAAAVVTFCAWLAVRPPLDPGADQLAKNTENQVPQNGITLVSAEQGVVNFFENDFKKENLDFMDANQSKLHAYLKENGALVPAEIPEALLGVPGIGCQDLVIEGKAASLVCHKTDQFGVVHLITFAKEDIAADLPSYAEANTMRSENDKWSLGHWEDEDQVYVLITNAVTPDKLSEVF